MKINKVTVVGANGTMGSNIAAIFASFGNCKVYMISRDIEKSKVAVEKAAKSVRAESVIANLIPADYSMLSDCVAKSDIVFESVSENFDVKLEVTKQIAETLREDAIACSGTSGLSITKLAECFSMKDRGRYFGIHMFNPPYNMSLCELITTQWTDAAVLKEIRVYLEETLLRTVVETNDYPAFLANRIGFQFINHALQYAEKYKNEGGIDYIDAIFGSFTGRAMPPLTTADFVGLDVHKAIVDNVYDNTEDFERHTFSLPNFTQELIDEGKLGRKVGCGLYKLQRSDDGVKNLLVYDISTGKYREVEKYSFEFAKRMKESIKEGNYIKAFQTLVADKSKEAAICLEFLLNYIVYSLITASQVAHDLNSVDDAMATGFNWCPPIAMLEVFSQVTDVKMLIKELLLKNNSTTVDVDELFANLKKSKYDYRSYFRA